jgi:hypothetical protein
LQFVVPRRNPTVRDRITLVNSRLKNALGEVKLVIHPRCIELIKDFEQVSYRAETNEIEKDRDARRTHLSDALGYLVYQECRAEASVGERPQRLF